MNVSASPAESCASASTVVAPMRCAFAAAWRAASRSRLKSESFDAAIASSRSMRGSSRSRGASACIRSNLEEPFLGAPGRDQRVHVAEPVLHVVREELDERAPDLDGARPVLRGSPVARFNRELLFARQRPQSIECLLGLLERARVVPECARRGGEPGVRKWKRRVRGNRLLERVEGAREVRLEMLRAPLRVPLYRLCVPRGIAARAAAT